MQLDEVEQALLRLELFAALEVLVESRGGFATLSELVNFEHRGQRMGLIDRGRGIRNPASLDETLSVVTSRDGPYRDFFGDDGILRYSFREGDPFGGDNRKLRRALTNRVPIIIFEKPLPNVYVPMYPAYVVGEEFDNRFFLIAQEAVVRANELAPGIDKSYVERTVQQRVHQPLFRASVMVAYRRTCAICRLNHPELLDAAHIIADSDQEGVAHVSNGLALRKIHHAAYDNNFIGISPDYIVHVNRALLEEVDGPMLKHGIQEMNGVGLTLPGRPADYPSRDALSARFDSFPL
jgi:putative restriction endonuclease